MCIGGGILNALIFVAGPRLIGYEDPRVAAPAASLLAIAVIYSAPMVAWMRHRGHQWSDGLEMTVAMLAPMFALVLPVELGVARYVPELSDQSLPIFSHVAMIAGMVVLMIYRFERYAHGARSHRA